MYPTGDDSDSNSDSTTDSSLVVHQTANRGWGLHEPSSDEEVEFCCSDAQKQAADGHFDFCQSSNQSSPVHLTSKEITDLDQTSDVKKASSDVLVRDKEKNSTEQLCQFSNSLKPLSSTECHINGAIEPSDKGQLLTKKTSGLKLFENSDGPVWSSILKLPSESQISLNTAAPRLKGLSIRSKNKAEEHQLQKNSPATLNSNAALNQSTQLTPLTTTSSCLRPTNRPDVNSCLALPKVSERKQVRPGERDAHVTKENSVHVGSRSQGKSHQPPTQRTFIEVQLSSLSGSSSPAVVHSDTVNSDSKLTPKGTEVKSANVMVHNTELNSLSCPKETYLPTSNGSKPNTAVETGETMKSSTSRLYIKTMERRSFSTDAALSVAYNPFSVRHKIKSFENLANFDRPVAKSSDIQSHALTYRASLNQRIAGYMDLVNSVDCRARQRSFSSYVETLIPTTPCSSALGKHPSNITLLNLDFPHTRCSTAPLLEVGCEAEAPKAPDGFSPQTPPVLRRKHGRLPRSRLQQLRALSMPELEKLCTEDFTRGQSAAEEKTETSTTETEKSAHNAARTEVDVNRVRQRDQETPQETPETHEPQPSWSISLKELADSPPSQCRLDTQQFSLTTKSYVSTLLQETRALSEVKDDTHLVVLSKEEGSGLGFSVAGGVDLEQKSITVHRVFTKGAASLEGTIQRGDSILSINGISLEGKTHGEAVLASIKPD
ncbi:hypothetical protein INR49_017310 [Caranx melampygus]|nr:hypothetical protein INR49_017310 [Caranx melampygus]